jgi:hypothetical protein
MQDYDSDNEKQLAQRLRDEAPRETFSPLLHARIMQRIDTERMQPRRRSEYAWGMIGRAGVAVAAVALVAIAVWRVAWYQPAPKMTVQQDIPAVDLLIVDLAASAGTGAQKQLGNFQMAYLDEDAQKFGAFVLDRLEVVEP